jgi:2-dehydropantoate 2-reductase
MRAFPRNITILGVGAMGCLFGGLLSRQKGKYDDVEPSKREANVFLFGSWREQIDALNSKGLTIIHPDGRKSLRQVQATSDLRDLPPADAVLILVKSYQTERATQLASRFLSSEGLVISLQNGLGNIDTLAASLGHHRIVPGATFHGANLVSPGHLHHAGGGKTHLALVSGLERQLTKIVDLLNASGLETNLVEHIDGFIWGKLAVNAAINPLTVLLEVSNGKLLTNDTHLKLMSAAANEVADIAGAQGIILPFSDAGEQAIKVCMATSENYSSMLQDIRRGAQTEIDGICGAVVRLGKRLGIPTPVNEAFLKLVKGKKVSQRVDLDRLLRSLNAKQPSLC